jgi:hypothetical protein
MTSGRVREVVLKLQLRTRGGAAHIMDIIEDAAPEATLEDICRLLNELRSLQARTIARR